VTLVGTTDVDHGASLELEPAITRGELDYLMVALRWQFPQLALGEDDVLATFAGVRPVIDSGQLDPSKEAREHALWLENGLLTVAGGKLTTFRVIALDALRRAAPLLPGWQADLRPLPIFDATPPLSGKALLLDGEQRARLLGRHGAAAQALCDAALDGELEPIPGTQTLWAQLRWGARSEDVQHLDDLLLRRTRLGLQLAGGALAIMPRLRAICQHELGWDDARWEIEQQRYQALWRRHYSVPQGD
jgi:glycerol-3-phosphate dehydrogenase